MFSLCLKVCVDLKHRNVTKFKENVCVLAAISLDAKENKRHCLLVCSLKVTSYCFKMPVAATQTCSRAYTSL